MTSTKQTKSPYDPAGRRVGQDFWKMVSFIAETLRNTPEGDSKHQLANQAKLFYDKQIGGLPVGVKPDRKKMRAAMTRSIQYAALYCGFRV